MKSIAAVKRPIFCAEFKADLLPLVLENAEAVGILVAAVFNEAVVRH